MSGQLQTPGGCDLLDPPLPGMRLDAHRSASTWCFAITHILQPRHRPFTKVGLQVPMSPTSLTLAVLPGGDAEEAQDVHCGICAAWRRAPVHCGRVMAGGPGSGAASSAAGETCPHSAAPGLQSTVPCHCVSDSQVHAALPWGPPTGLGGHVIKHRLSLPHRWTQKGGRSPWTSACVDMLQTGVMKVFMNFSM